MKTMLLAKSHPKHYLLHKYWGRKPYNIVKEYIKKYTKKGDTVYDPFMGSGVSIIESVKLGRKAIGVDLNPLSCFITRTTLEHIDLEKFSNYFKGIIESCRDIETLLYKTQCIKCKGKALITNTVWDGNVPKRIRGTCENCGIFLKNPDKEDEKRIKYIEDKFVFLCDKNKIRNLPNDYIIKYVRRSGVSMILDLFTKRNIIALGILKSKIDKIKNYQSQDLLKLTFSSMLPNVSSMIPGNSITGNARSGWVISKLYIPKIHAEKNVFLAFKQRFSTINKGKEELRLSISNRQVKIFNQSSENIKKILKDNSIDYIFADPPYGENIPYFGCSMVFNSWLGLKTDFDNEIICDNYRGKDIQDYKDRLVNVMRECYRVLKPNKYLTMTFNNRDFRIWKVILDVVRKSSFRLIDITHHHSAVSSGMQGLNKKSAIKGDFFYTFKKINRISLQEQFEFVLHKYEDIENYMIKRIEEVINRKGGATTSEIYENLIPTLVNNNMLGRCASFLKSIDEVLNNHFRLVIEKENNKKTDIYKWYTN